MSNRSPHAYREVSVANVSFELTTANLVEHFLGRECYRRTRTIVVRNGNQSALISVDPVDAEPLFSPAARVDVLALPHETVFVQRPDLDTGVPSQLAREVVPPHPAKLLDQAQRILDLAEDLPPIVLLPELVDLASLVGDAPVVLLPCRGSGIDLAQRRTLYLDERPPRDDWALLGCARSRQIHQWFYDDVSPGVDTCPRNLASPDGGDGLLLTKCCLFEDRIEDDGRTVIVPWGASLDHVREALSLLAQRAEVSWEPA